MLRTLQIGKTSEPWSKKIIAHWLTPVKHLALLPVILSFGMILLCKRLGNYRLLLLPESWGQALLTPVGRLFGYKVFWVTDSSQISPHLGKLLKKSARLAQAIIAPNQAQEVSYLRLGIPSAKIHLIYPPVATKSQPSYLEPKTLALSCDASIEAEEGLGTLLRAMSLARDILGNLKLILGGSFAGKAYLDWSAKQLNLDGCVQLSPGENELWLETVQVYILPTASDKPVPTSLAQAMSLGKTLIVSDKPNHREFIEHEKNGLLVPVADAEALSQAIIRLAREGELLSKLGQGSYKFAQERFAPQVFENKLKSLILG